MEYTLGVDLGTTYTAAAIAIGDRLEIVDLGTRSAVVPSVVYARDDGTLLTGEAALRRGTTNPLRMSREFKRRMGDTTAILLGGTPYSVDALMASLLRSVVERVAERQAGRPSSIGIAHPANWGQYKKDLLEQAVRRADLDGATFVTEPQAAAVHYATLERLDAGAIVAVYDLGGGTFDAAVVRKTAGGFELIGEPEGIERLGGIDFDEAVFHHVLDALGDARNQLDPDDVVVQAALVRLREECVAAKEALSSDTETSIPVILPGVQTDVVITREQFEAMIRPALSDTLVVLRRAVRSAGIEPSDLHSVLLVGGTSRIPLIAELVANDLDRPVMRDAHPKHSVALGAAAIAAGSAVPATEPVPATGPATPTIPVPTPTEPVAITPPPTPEPVTAEPVAPEPVRPAPGAIAPPTTPAPVPTPPPPDDTPARRRPAALWFGVAAAAVILAVVVAVALIPDGDDGREGAAATVASTDPSDDGTSVEPTDGASAEPTEPTGDDGTAGGTTSDADVSATTQAPPYTSTTTSTTSTTMAPIYPCTGVDEPCVIITDLTVDENGAVQVTWEPQNFVPDVDQGYHAHLFWNTYTAAQASTDAPAAEQALWDAVEETVHTSQQVLTMANRPPDATGVCAATGLAPAHVVPNPSLVHCVDLPPDSL